LHALLKGITDSDATLPYQRVEQSRKDEDDNGSWLYAYDDCSRKNTSYSH
jgi:hypothetical protein